ncbi:MAG TPA: GTPase domain-containing protein [Candidatus Acidoferrales bacterium]|nr:GTPase domain-containing protein [Candidatus Acidoferrales bacterium]
MALINHRTREIHFKIVYYGCGLCGKTTNLRSLHDRLPPERRGKLISIATDHERTLFFDFLPIDLGQVNGFTTRFHLYTVPGQVYYKLSRRAVLQGVDGVVFVADSHPSREHANAESLADLHEHLRTLGLEGPALARIPWVVQYNKRDLPLAVPLARLRAAVNERDWPEFEAVASEGRGVTETLRSICKSVLARLAPGAAPAHAAPAPAPAGFAAAAPDAPRPVPASDPAARPAAPRAPQPPSRRAPAFSAAPLRTSRFPLPPPRPAASAPRPGASAAPPPSDAPPPRPRST